MTAPSDQPAQPDQPAPAVPDGDGVEQLQVGIRTAVVRQPNGKHWAQLEVMCGLTKFTLLVPPATADDLGARIGPALTEAAAVARRHDIGLIVAPANGHLPPPGGLPPGGAGPLGGLPPR